MARPPKRARRDSREGPGGSDVDEDVDGGGVYYGIANDGTGEKVRLTQDEEFWYEDGSIFLETTKVVFKVYRGPLIAQSPVFKDMLSIPQPSNTHTQLRDHPVIHLTDSPEDLRHVLRVLMPSKNIHPFGIPEPSIHALSAWIRLGDKYQIDGLIQEALKYLRTVYPGDYHEYRERDVVFPNECAIAVVNLARFTNADYLLPVAFLDCCALGADLAKGFLREDGHVEHLSSGDLGICLNAQVKLAWKRAQLGFRLFSKPPSDGCAWEKDEPAALRAVRQCLMKDEDPSVVSARLFDPWIDLLGERYSIVCMYCRMELQEHEEAYHRHFFEYLPELVGVKVDGWER